jgi:hypothetical protein
MLLASSPSRVTDLRIDRATPQATGLSWKPSVESGVTSYIVAYGPAGDPLRHRVSVVQPHATLPALAPGTTVSVKAVNARRLESWDWARIVVRLPSAQKTPTP